VVILKHQKSTLELNSRKGNKFDPPYNAPGPRLSKTKHNKAKFQPHFVWLRMSQTKGPKGSRVRWALLQNRAETRHKPALQKTEQW